MVLFKAIIDGDRGDEVWVQVVLDALGAADLDKGTAALRVANKRHNQRVSLGEHVKVHKVAAGRHIVEHFEMMSAVMTWKRNAAADIDITHNPKLHNSSTHHTGT